MDGWFKEVEKSAVLEEQNWAGDKGLRNPLFETPLIQA